MKPGRWWRAQNSCVDNAKLILLSDKAHRNWFNLNCVANEHGGVLPALEIVAVKLRLSEARAAAAIAELVAKRLFDKREDGAFVPHDWTEWQFKTDSADSTNADRQRAHRKRQKEEMEALRNGKRNAVTDVTAKRPDTEDREQKEDRMVDARARPSEFTEGSKALSSALWKALGFKTALEIPPELAGADWRAISWEKSGWTPDLIEVHARKIGPGKPLNYYEKVFSTEFAKLQAPLPVVEIKHAEKLTVTKHGTSQANPGGSLIAAIDRQLAAIEAEASADPALPEGPVLCISNGPIR